MFPELPDWLSTLHLAPALLLVSVSRAWLHLLVIQQIAPLNGVVAVIANSPRTTKVQDNTLRFLSVLLPYKNVINSCPRCGV